MTFASSRQHCVSTIPQKSPIFLKKCSICPQKSCVFPAYGSYEIRMLIAVQLAALIQHDAIKESYIPAKEPNISSKV